MRRFYLITLAISIVLFCTNAPGLFKQDVVYASAYHQTVPTRTPTPLPVTPTATPDDSSSGNEPPEQATQPPPSHTATAVSLPPTPVGGLLPTALPCSTQPTLKAINHVNPTNVRLGPGIDYEITSQLIVNEVRPIIGRAADAPWWLIQLANGETGWVADEVIQVQGNTVGVPIAPTPLLANVTTTPGAPWQPTPLSHCPTSTAKPNTATPAPTVARATSASTLVVAPLASHTPAVSYPVTVAQEGLTNVKELSAVTPTYTATPITLPTLVAVVPPAVTAVPTNTITNNANRADNSGFLLAGAALLLVAGAAVFIIRRR